ncbi:MAG: aldose 1-epimerase [bacterium]
MFRINKTKIGSIVEYQLFNGTTGEYGSIIPSQGALVRELSLAHDGVLHQILDGPQSDTEILNNLSWKGAKLIPYQGRIPGGKYLFHQTEYQLQENTHPSWIHGFIHNKPFRVLHLAATQQKASFILSYLHAGDTPGYPFKFEVQVEYTLTAKEFLCKTIISNKDQIPLPIGDGWHPYFTFGAGIDTLTLELPAHSHLELNEEKIPTGRILSFPKGQAKWRLEGKDLDSVIVLPVKSGISKTKLMNESNGRSITLWQDTGTGKYNYVAVYTPKHRQSIAVEPWSSAPNALNNGMGLVVLKPERTFHARYGVTLE